MLTEKLQNIPKSSGCYLFKDKKGQIIYVGKAKHLPNRVKSYFSGNKHSDKTKLLVENVADVDFLTTLDENSALVLENDLIKAHKPKFNIKLKVTFLGTGTSQGIPIIGSTHPVCLSTNPKDKRLRVSVLIEWDDLSVLIDCSPDFRQQLLRTSCTKIDAVLFTHEHSDHTAGIDDLRPFYFRQGNLHIYAHERVLNGGGDCFFSLS